jgi:hypothetical protein
MVLESVEQKQTKGAQEEVQVRVHEEAQQV